MSGVKNTIKSADEISLLFEKAKRINTVNLIALIAKADCRRGHNGRAAFIAGKKLGNAPKRNRAKRLMREAARIEQAPWQGYDTIFIAKERIKNSNLEKIIKDIHTVKSELEGIEHFPNQTKQVI